MEATALRVAERFLSARADAGLVKFQQLTSRARKELELLPRLFKTYERQAHGYKTSDPVKAKTTLAKILTKVKAIHDGHAAAVRLVDAFNASYAPTTDFKQRIHSDDFMTWFGKYLKALKELKSSLADNSVTMLGYGLDNSFVRPGMNPLLDLDNAATSISMYWDTLAKADPDPVSIPAGGSNTQRFLAFLTPSVRRLAKQVASKLKKNPAVAHPLIWLILEDVNADAASNIAEGILPHDDAAGHATAKTFVPAIAKELDYGVVQAAVFGVALLEEVGDAALAKRLTGALADELSEETVAA